MSPEAGVAPIARFDRVGKRYGGRLVVSDVSFTLAAGEILGLVGANGGGKTTTLRLLAGLTAPSAGEGEALGAPLGRLSPAARRRLGVMTQANSLYPDLSVEANLRFRAEVCGLDDAGARVAAAADRYGLTSRLKDRVSTLSGGWARRAQFAASVLHGPKLLLLDEPTSGLDVVSRRELWAATEALAAAGAAIVISTHDLEEAERLPRLLFYHEGRCHGPLTPAALRARGRGVTLSDAVARLAAEGAFA